MHFMDFKKLVLILFAKHIDAFSVLMPRVFNKSDKLVELILASMLKLLKTCGVTSANAIKEIKNQILCQPQSEINKELFAKKTLNVKSLPLSSLIYKQSFTVVVVVSVMLVAAVILKLQSNDDFIKRNKG